MRGLIAVLVSLLAEVIKKLLMLQTDLSKFEDWQCEIEHVIVLSVTEVPLNTARIFYKCTQKK